jgi:nucleoside-diphosphate-sugar epimerase
MRIFVAGAAGAVGRSLLPRLCAAGHSVTGLTRNPANADVVRSLGARPVVADGLDTAVVKEAVARAEPEVIVHEMTDLKGENDLRAFDASFAQSNRLRTAGTDNLIAAAQAAGVKRFVAQSFCGWPYAHTGAPVKSETDPLDPDPPDEFRHTLDGIRYLEAAVTNSCNFVGLALRYGAFYGVGTGIFDGPMIDGLRKRRVPLIGRGDGWWSFVHIDDAAAATAIAATRGEPGIYNIVDDDPAPVSSWLPALAEMLGARPPFRIPEWLAGIVAGRHVVTLMTEVRAGTNAKAKRELGWALEHPSWRQGFLEVVQEERRLRHAA